ncbi:hypothetical protein AB0E54_41855 [Amycolatopsis coloradensis]|uniref:hypothetical protein n=1 Tax=Amycolatopsis coloradensis TaxID=76021 RepID=UPI0033D7DC50
MNTPHEDTLARTGDLRFVATDGPVIGSLCTGVAGLASASRPCSAARSPGTAR